MNITYAYMKAGIFKTLMENAVYNIQDVHEAREV